ncbi:hypothetical protein L6452_35478 [Arctium lappa]|uniref:Uncharacterized protein n=1 Tax=Arctium lappa TaxID=4217 RepID=A0ACB8Y6N3_ARCLA|nr:hypothetical protein L6452_35478 [Arctium lappa]
MTSGGSMGGRSSSVGNLGSIVVRSSSNGSLQQNQTQFQNGGVGFQQQMNQSTTTQAPASKKASKTFVNKEKDNAFMWIFKFAPRKKVGMLLLSIASTAAMLWILYIAKGDINQKNSSFVRFSGYSPSIDEERVQEFNSALVNDQMKITLNDDNRVEAQPPPPLITAHPPPPPIITHPPPPPVYFTGYTLPPGNPCESFRLPPPPADKKKTGPRPCPVCYLPVEDAIALMPKAPSFSPVLHNLTYIHEENLTKTEFGGSDFGGYPSIKQRDESYDIKESMAVHCGFVRGDRPGRKSGFDIDDSDLLQMDECHGVVVASAIFGAYDLIQQPVNISETAKQNVCFFMFIDEETEKFMRNSSHVDYSKKIGLWNIVVIYNLPYTDPRRNGKVPKLLSHRLFPNARYSIWMDGKLKLIVDPYQILERFLWRENASFAISRHYKRFDVFIEAEANKAAAKYDNASIDFQIDFYRKEGLTPYSEAKLPIRSDVPEGCVVIREHVPISNLFTCLWFNEVDRFTSRDQISFSTVRDKIRSKTNWTVNMFWDCERRNFVIQGYHRDVLEHWAPPPPPGAPVVSNTRPSIPTDKRPKNSTEKISEKQQQSIKASLVQQYLLVEFSQGFERISFPMEIPFDSINFTKSQIRVSFSPSNLLQFALILALFISKSTSISPDLAEVPYSEHCNDVVRESESTETQLSANDFLRLDKAVYSLGFEKPRFNFNPVLSQIASFSTRKAYETKSKGIFKVNAILNLVGPNIVDYFSGDITRRRLRLVKIRPPRIEPRKNVGAEFRLLGFYDSVSGKLCMVGSGSVSFVRSINVVFKLNYPNSSVLNSSLVNGTLQSVTPSGSGNYFKPISILGVSRMGYNFSFIHEEIKNGGFNVYDEMENVSLGLPDSQTVICSIITWGLRFELDYNRYDCNNSSCSFRTVGDEILPRFMSIKVVDCLNDGKVRYILQFSNSSYGKGYSFYPLTSLVAEGEWDEKKKRLALVGCQVFDEMSERGCSIRLAFSFPSTLSLKHRSSVVGKMWSTERKSLGYVSFQSPANLNSRIKNASYEYLEHEKVGNLCGKSLGGKAGKGTYPDEQSPNLRFDMMVRNKKGQLAYGYASPFYVFDKFYSPFAKVESRHSSSDGYVNISYVMSFTTRGEFEFGSKVPSHKMVEISAEGMYNTKTGVICMVGCKHMPYEKFQRKRSLDCELVIDINYSPLNGKDAGMVVGSIKTTRKKSDPLYFEPIEFGSSSISTVQARESIWRMDLEITMVLISNTLACIFIGSQLFHAKKNPESPPFVSVIMLVVLMLSHMIPLLLNFEAIFLVNRKQNVFLGTDQWLEVNEVLVRVITMVAFVLQFGLLQLTWSSRNGPESPKNLWVSDKKVLYASIPLYVAGGLTAWFAHSLQSSHTKPIHLSRQRFHAQNSVTFWGELKSYVGLILDGFLIPQIVFNFFCDAREPALAPSFYVGSTLVRLLPHVYDLYRTHSSSWFYDKIYANPRMDYYSTTWDVAVCCGGTIFVLVIYVQQRFGGRSVVPKRFRERVLYQKVPVTTQEQQVF